LIANPFCYQHSHSSQRRGIVSIRITSWACAHAPGITPRAQHSTATTCRCASRVEGRSARKGHSQKQNLKKINICNIGRFGCNSRQRLFSPLGAPRRRSRSSWTACETMLGSGTSSRTLDKIWWHPGFSENRSVTLIDMVGRDLRLDPIDRMVTIR